MSRVVLGYHGTSMSNAESILGGEPFRPSQNRYDWLGDGVYFWEYGPVRAYQWARETHGDETVVLRAKIRLANCLDLTDLKGTQDLREAYTALANFSADKGVALPKQRGKYRALDRVVINFFASSFKPAILVVRSAFIEGERLWEESGFWDHAHVQVAVRDLSLVSQVQQVEDPYSEEF